MKRSFFFALVLAFTLSRPLWAGDENWQRGRIEDVQKKVETKTLYWIVNTPVTKDVTTYSVSVHLDETLLTGTYEPDKAVSPPPEQWTKTWPVQIHVVDDYMFLKTPDGSELKLRIVKRKRTERMVPVTDAELAKAYASPDTTPPESLVGFSSSKPDTGAGTSVKKEPEPEQHQSTQGPIGWVSITTVPYLAEIYLDGKSVGYSPAKLSLPVGKHTLRFEKEGYETQSKEVNVLEDSEFTVYVTLEQR